MKLRILGAAAGLLLLAACNGESGDNGSANAAPLTPIPAPNGASWTETVAVTPEGGVRMGNPDAPVKLVEYASFTCPHCREFAEQGAAKLENDYVKSGHVSWEFRPFILFPTDPAISMLMRCQAAQNPSAFFQLVDQLYAEQPNWVGRLQALPPEAQQQFEALPPQQRSAAMIQAAGVDQFFRVRGMPASRIAACLGDAQGLQEVVGITDRATSKEGVTGTPTFFINGRMVPDTASWGALEPPLRAATR
jgi:protein-disulfide isomerase